MFFSMLDNLEPLAVAVSS